MPEMFYPDEKSKYSIRNYGAGNRFEILLGEKVVAIAPNLAKAKQWIDATLLAESAPEALPEEPLVSDVSQVPSGRRPSAEMMPGAMAEPNAAPTPMPVPGAMR